MGLGISIFCISAVVLYLVSAYYRTLRRRQFIRATLIGAAIKDNAKRCHFYPVPYGGIVTKVQRSCVLTMPGKLDELPSACTKACVAIFDELANSTQQGRMLYEISDVRLAEHKEDREYYTFVAHMGRLVPYA